MNDKHGLFQRVLVSGDFLFKLGVFVVLSGASLTGWGCSCPCGAGADYGTAVGPCAAVAGAGWSLLHAGGICAHDLLPPQLWFCFSFHVLLCSIHCLFANFFLGGTSLCLSHLISVYLIVVIASRTLILHGLQNVEQVLQVYLEIMEYDTDHINTYSHTYYIYIFNIWYNLIGSTLAKSGCFASILVIAFFLCWSRCAASSNGEGRRRPRRSGSGLGFLGNGGDPGGGLRDV